MNPKKFKNLDNFLDFFQIPKISEFKVSSNGSRYSEIITGNIVMYLSIFHRLQNKVKNTCYHVKNIEVNNVKSNHDQLGLPIRGKCKMLLMREREREMARGVYALR